MILRIDDTDRQRSSQEYFSSILESMKWLGLTWDEGPDIGGDYGPYIQSENLHKYRELAEQLVRDGKAYYCFCTAEQLEAEKEKQRQKGQPPRYSGRCRLLSEEERERRKLNESYVIRFITPREGETVVEDIIRGRVAFENKIFDDFIIIKSDGLPTYNFASVIDDHNMAISHVIRAEEHLSNTPRQIIIAHSLGFQVPLYAHVPMILAPDHSKLSKRHGATSVQEYRDMGILPEALVNYLALLGWSPGEDKEIMDIKEIVDLFSLERVSKNPAIYDIKKLTWLNGYYLRTLKLEKITERALPFMQRKFNINTERNTAKYKEIERIIDLVRDRVKTLQEMADASNYFFEDDFQYDEKGVKKHFRKEGVGEVLTEVSHVLQRVEPFEAEKIRDELHDLGRKLNVSLSRINLPTRLALTGRTMGPELFDIISLLGKDRVINRLKKARELFELS